MWFLILWAGLQCIDSETTQKDASEAATAAQLKQLSIGEKGIPKESGREAEGHPAEAGAEGHIERGGGAHLRGLELWVSSMRRLRVVLINSGRLDAERRCVAHEPGILLMRSIHTATQDGHGWGWEFLGD